MNYFQFYHLPESFLLDEKSIKNIYYRLSREYHPDFFTLESPEKQQKILEMSTQNTNAFRTLSDFDRRMQYILEQHGLLEEGGSNALPNDFLMEVMELNEQLMELEMDFDPEIYASLQSQTQAFEAELKAEIWPTLEAYENLPLDGQEEALLKVKNYYLKRRYLLRIQDSLHKFAPHS